MLICIICLLDHEISELQAENRSIKQQVRGNHITTYTDIIVSCVITIWGKYILLGYMIFPI